MSNATKIAIVRIVTEHPIATSAQSRALASCSFDIRMVHSKISDQNAVPCAVAFYTLSGEGLSAAAASGCRCGTTTDGRAIAATAKVDECRIAKQRSSKEGIPISG